MLHRGNARLGVHVTHHSSEHSHALKGNSVDKVEQRHPTNHGKEKELSLTGSYGIPSLSRTECPPCSSRKNTSYYQNSIVKFVVEWDDKIFSLIVNNFSSSQSLFLLYNYLQKRQWKTCELVKTCADYHHHKNVVMSSLVKMVCF